MQRRKLLVLCQGIAACAVWACGFAMLQSASPAQTTETPAEKTAKPKKAKKAATDAATTPAAAVEKTSKKSKAATESPATPAAAGEKAVKSRTPKKPAADVTAPVPAAPAAVEEKASKPRKSKKAAADVTGPAPATPAPGEAVPIPRRANRSVPEVIVPSGSANRANRSAEPPAASVSEAEIQAAKAGGMVWVNTDSGVYHKGGRWYGATKQGKFMSERDAIRAGYRAAKRE
uniref:Helix-hairpin-helix motif protein n=1 Tax=Solibacter usitatus (strain Ellin6076) TaxID=234267 RepID=Q01WY4_SOLUE